MVNVFVRYNNDEWLSKPHRKWYGVVVHYSAVPSADTVEGVAKQLKAIDQYHRNKGWSGIGYNIGVDKWGGVWLLRGLNKVGAHCRGHNLSNVGVVMLGDAHELAELTPHTIAVVKKLCEKLRIGVHKVHLHKDYLPTVCPPLSDELLKQWRKEFPNIGISQRGDDNG